MAPFLGVPTVAMYNNDALLAPHLFVARQAGRRVNAAPFSPLDLNALARLGYEGDLESALASWAGTENLEERLDGIEHIDPVVLEELRRR